jgi:hypothetical protein
MPPSSTPTARTLSTIVTKLMSETTKQDGSGAKTPLPSTNALRVGELENRRACKRPVGSNPTPAASNGRPDADPGIRYLVRAAPR